MGGKDSGVCGRDPVGRLRRLRRGVGLRVLQRLAHVPYQRGRAVGVGGLGVHAHLGLGPGGAHEHPRVAVVEAVPVLRVGLGVGGVGVRLGGREHRVQLGVGDSLDVGLEFDTTRSDDDDSIINSPGELIADEDSVTIHADETTEPVEEPS